MKIDTITIIASGVLLAAALLVLCAGHLRRRHHLRRLLVTDLLRDYFKGGMAAAQLGRRTREIASRHFTGSNEFYALTVSAFQRAIDANLAQQAHTEQVERKLLNAMANLKQEFGLTDRYQVEAWRPWRE
jgi:predicted urease superfamily metal-dependent hydrolase